MADRSSGIVRRVSGVMTVSALAGVALFAGPAFALTQDQAPAPAAQPKDAAPAAQPKDGAPPPPATAAKPLPGIPGVIRHGLKDPKPRTPGAIRIATYNIENLFTTDQPGEKDGGEGGGGWGTPAKPAEHKAAAAEAIKRIDADIIALQEIESKEALIAFRDEYLKGLGYDHVASIDAGDPRGIEQSIISRFPITAESNWPRPEMGVHPEKLGRRPNRDAGKPLVMARSPLKATIEVPADKTGTGKPYTLTFLVVHHKSGAFYTYQREAEGKKVAAWAGEILTADPKANVIITGDFNAMASEASVQTYLTSGFVNALAGKDPKDATFQTHASNRAIDIILLSPGAAADMVKDSGFVLGTMQRPEDADWRRTPPPTGYASDHYPVVIDLMPRE